MSTGTETLADTVKAVYGQSFRLPTAEELGISVPSNCSFAGWSVASGSDTVYYGDGQEIATGLTGENGTVVYLYAVIWKNVSYKVTLPASGEGYTVYYIPENVVAVGNPCRILREIGERDKVYFYKNEKIDEGL